MVQFCPKCGTKAPDDESVFCNKCGTRLPPVIPEKKELVCPRCGTTTPDEQSVFCNKCGGRLQAPPPVQMRQAASRMAAAPPAVQKRRCPSCGAPFVDEISVFCNVCGADFRKPVPAGSVPMPQQEQDMPHPPKSAPGIRDTGVPTESRDEPGQKRSRRPLLKWGLAALVAVIILVVIAAFLSGAIPPGTDQSPETTPLPTGTGQAAKTTPQAPAKTQTTAPATTPAKTPAATPLATATPANNSTNTSLVTSTAVAVNASTNKTANASVTVRTTPVVSDMSQPFSLGQTATNGKANVTVNSITYKDKLSDPIPSYAIGKKYLIVEITFENLQNATADANTNGMLVKDGGGYTFDPATDGMLENPLTIIGKEIPPHEKRTGNMVFIVPPGATLLTFQYDFGNQLIATFRLT